MTVSMSASYQCLPDMIQEREVVMYCPDIVPQCRTRTFALPQACVLQEVKCISTIPRRSLGQTDNLPVITQIELSIRTFIQALKIFILFITNLSIFGFFRFSEFILNFDFIYFFCIFNCVQNLEKQTILLKRHAKKMMTLQLFNHVQRYLNDL